MTLTEGEYKEYLSTHLRLLYFAGVSSKVLPTETNYSAFKKLDIEVKYNCRNALLSDMNILDEYIASNHDHLTPEQLTILEGFHRKIQDKFLIVKCLKSHAIFRGFSKTNNTHYAVHALQDRFDEMIEDFPCLVNAVLIPFRSKIIYDGFLTATGVYFGPGIRSDINNAYMNAKRSSMIVKHF